MEELVTPRNPTTSLLDVAATRLVAGDQVDVQNRFDGSWSSGFEIAEVLGPPSQRTYRIRRLSDGEILPARFARDLVTGTRSPSTGLGPARPIPLHPSEQPALGLLAS